MSQANIETVTAYLTALGAGDAAGLASVLHPDVVAVSMGTSALSGARGRDDIVGTAGLLRRLIPGGIEFEITSTTCEGDRIALEVSGQSTLVTGQPYNNTYAFFITVRNQQIIALTEYFCSKLVEEKLVPLVAGG